MFQITVFRMGEGAQDIDLAILTALLKGKYVTHCYNNFTVQKSCC